MKKIVLILQARMGSTRLPGKSMMDLAGEPLIARILERVKRCKMPDIIVLAIPNTEQDKVLLEVGKKYGVEVYSGSELDLVQRYYDAAKKFHADLVVRIPADNATPEPSEIDRIIKHHLSLSIRGFTSNLSVIQNSGYPDGIGAEVFDFSLLEEAKDKFFDQRKREHVHLNFYDYETSTSVDEDWCPIRTIKCPEEFRRPDLVLDVNTDKQYQFMKELYEYLYPKNSNFTIQDTINWYDNVYVNGNGKSNEK